MKKTVPVLLVLLLLLLAAGLSFSVWLPGSGSEEPEAPDTPEADRSRTEPEGDEGAGSREGASVDGGPARDEGTGRLPPDDVAEVRVLGPGGSPVAGVRVLLLRESNDPVILRRPEIVAEGVTDAGGRVRLPAVPFERFMLKVVHPDFAIAGDVECFGGNVTEFPLGPGGVVYGCVKELETGRPVAGATVYMMDWCMVGMLHEWCVETDGDGRYRIEGVGPGKLNMRVWCPERPATPPPLSFDVEAGRETRVDFLLPRGVRLLLNVLDAETGRPVPEVTVTQGWNRTVTGDGASLATPPLSPDGVSYFLVSADGYVTRAVKIEVGKLERPQDPLKLPLSRPLPVKGKVVGGGGDPLPGARVFLSSQASEPASYVQVQTTTGADGSFDARAGVPGGELTYEVVLRGGAVRRGGPISIPADAETVTLPPVDFGRNVTLSGRVLEPEGGPPPRAYIEARTETKEGTLVTASGFLDPQGRFRLPGVSEGSVVLRLSALDGWPGQERRLEVHEDETISWALAPGYEITGRLLTEEGEGRSRVWIECRPSGAMAMTDEEGRFRFRGLGPGPHRVSPRFEDEPCVEDVPGNTFGLELRMPGER